MRNFEIENEMYRRARELIEKRYPAGWGGAGIVHTERGHYFTSVSIETENASTVLCIETGAMLEAHKFDEKVTHCMCLVRDDEKSDFKILTPCGICHVITSIKLSREWRNTPINQGFFPLFCCIMSKITPSS